MKNVRFKDKKTRNVLRNRIRELSPGKTISEIVTAMNTEGFKRPDGTALTVPFVQAQRYAMGLRGYKKSRKKAFRQSAVTRAEASKAMAATGTDCDALADLIIAARIPNSKKLGLLKQLW